MLKEGLEFRITRALMVVHILSVDEENNSLEVQITSPTSGIWTEKWNLAHTRRGFELGEYRSIN